LPDAFAYLQKLRREGLLSRAVVDALQGLAAEGEFDQILKEARGVPVSRRERAWLRRSLPKE
jgi:hypothetical protein